LFAVATFSENARNQIDHGRNDGLPTCSFAKPDREGIPQLGRRVWDETIHCGKSSTITRSPQARPKAGSKFPGIEPDFLGTWGVKRKADEVGSSPDSRPTEGIADRFKLELAFDGVGPSGCIGVGRGGSW